MPGECGWQAMLKIANISPTKEHVSHLREAAAQTIYDARVKQRPIQGMYAHDVLQAEQMGLQQYCAAIRNGMWASKHETFVCANMFGVDIAYIDNTGISAKGNPVYVVVKIGEHFVLYRLHGKVKKHISGPCFNKAGMRAWTREAHHRPREDQVPSPKGLLPTQHVPTSRVTKVDCSLFRSPKVVDMTIMVSQDGNIMELKNMIAPMISRHQHMFELHTTDDLENDLPDWVQIPTHVVIKDVIPSNSQYVDLEIQVPARFVSFRMRVMRTVSRFLLESEIAKILNVMPQFLQLKSNVGTQWNDLQGEGQHELIVDIFGPCQDGKIHLHH